MMKKELTVITNDCKLVHERPGFGSSNQPERRQMLILEHIKNHLSCDFISNPNIEGIESWVTKIHCPQFLDFLKIAYADFSKHDDKHWGNSVGGLVPNHFFKKLPNKRVPPYKLSGYYGSDFMTPIYGDTYENALQSAASAYKSAEIAWLNNSPAYALVCSPGHHAKWNEYGGYCFINNGLVAAYRFIELGAKRTAVLDIDYHAGNGTSDIVAINPLMRDKVYCWSLHGDPIIEYPSFDGFEDDYESSQIKNVPLCGKYRFENYRNHLIAACDEINKLNCDAVVVAFGGDTFRGDPDANPNGGFLFDLENYVEIGQIIRQKLGSKIVITQEGGYDMQNIAQIVGNFLKGCC
jgi:acetoin utilization deacetylase AcuC-like enzyme